MKAPAAPVDPLLDRILYDRKMSGGRMPVEIIVEDDAEKAHGQALLKGMRNVANLSLVTKAELLARIAGHCSRWRRELLTKRSP